LKPGKETFFPRTFLFRKAKCVIFFRMNFDPAKHHQSSPRLSPTGRRSIRLKGHDYASGGIYFVTLCAHRDAGNIFASEIIREMIAREWESAAGGWGART
jgi:hypothetical protein